MDDGQVHSRVRESHRHQEFLGHPRQSETRLQPDLDLLLIVDKRLTHQHAKSWRDQVKRCFALITERAIRRNSPTAH